MSRVLPIVCCFGLSIGAIGVENVEDAAPRSIGPAAIRADVAFRPMTCSKAAVRVLVVTILRRNMLPPHPDWP